MTIFSLAVSAQNTNATANGMQNGVSNGRVSVPSNDPQMNGVSNVMDTKAGRNTKIKNERSNSVAIDPVVESTTRVRIERNVNSADHDQINHFNRPGQIDRYGYQGTPLSSNGRPCLVSGARRCVQ